MKAKVSGQASTRTKLKMFAKPARPEKKCLETKNRPKLNEKNLIFSVIASGRPRVERGSKRPTNTTGRKPKVAFCWSWFLFIFFN